MLTLEAMSKSVRIWVLVAVLATVSLLLSCSRVERVEDSDKQEIVMSPFGTSLTKAEQGQLGTDKVFGIYAYHADCPGGTAWDNPMAWASSSLYLEDVAFSHQSGSWAGRDQAYYWPFEGSLMFAGYCPQKEYSEGTVTSIDFVPNLSDKNPYLHIGFTQKTTPADMVDLLWFDVKDVSNGEAISKTNLPVHLKFKHALSKVSFEFQDVANYFYLSSIKLKDCINSSEFYSGATPGWLPDIDAVADYELLNVAESDEKPLFNGWTSEEQILFIIPQYLDGIFPTMTGTLDNGLDVVLEFTLTDGFGSEVVSVPLKNFTQRWEMGMHYHYTISVNADPIGFVSPSVTITQQVVSM